MTEDRNVYCQTWQYSSLIFMDKRLTCARYSYSLYTRHHKPLNLRHVNSVHNLHMTLMVIAEHGEVDRNYSCISYTRPRKHQNPRCVNYSVHNLHMTLMVIDNSNSNIHAPWSDDYLLKRH